MSDIPRILQDASDTEHRFLKVPAFEVPLRLKDDLLDPFVLDRIALRLEVAISGGRPQIAVKEVNEKLEDGTKQFKGYTITQTKLVYESDVVPGSPLLTGYERAPEQLMLPVAEDAA